MCILAELVTPPSLQMWKVYKFCVRLPIPGHQRSHGDLGLVHDLLCISLIPKDSDLRLSSSTCSCPAGSIWGSRGAMREVKGTQENGSKITFEVLRTRGWGPYQVESLPHPILVNVCVRDLCWSAMREENGYHRNIKSSQGSIGVTSALHIQKLLKFLALHNT